MSEPLRRLLLFSEHYPPTMGGVATSAQRIGRTLVQLGIEVHVATFDHSRPLEDDDYSIRQDDRGVDVNRFGPFFLKHADPAAAHLSEKHRAILRRRVFNRVTELGARTGVQAVLSLYVLNAGFLSGLVANALRISHFAGVRGNDVGRNIFDVARFGVIAWTLQNARRILCVNRHLRERLLIAFPQLADVSIAVPNGVPAPPVIDAAAARARIVEATGWCGDDVVAVFVGTPREKKGIVQLLRAMASLPYDSPVRLLVVGPQIGGVERRIAGTLWDELVSSRRLHATGLIDRCEVHRWIAGGDAVVMPSLDDGMANGLLEGMALGLCPIATPLFDDVIRDGETGWLVEVSDVGRALERAAADRDRTRSLGAAAREYVLRHHSPEAEGRVYIERMNEAMP